MFEPGEHLERLPDGVRGRDVEHAVVVERDAADVDRVARDPVVRDDAQPRVAPRPEDSEIAVVLRPPQPRVARGVLGVVVRPVREPLPVRGERRGRAELDALGRARAAALQIAREAAEVEVDLVRDLLLEVRGLEVQAARGVVLGADVVAAARLVAQRRRGGRRERERPFVVRDLVEARRAEPGAVAQAVLQHAAVGAVVNVRRADPAARVRAEVVAVVVARADREEES